MNFGTPHQTNQSSNTTSDKIFYQKGLFNKIFYYIYQTNDKIFSMKNLKQKFKRGLFGFFREEIMEYVKDKRAVNVVDVSNRIDFVELKAEILLRNDRQEPFGQPIGVVYEQSLEECRKRLFDECMKHVVVDTETIIDPHLYDARAIRLKMYIGKQQER